MSERKAPTGEPLSLRISLLDLSTLLYHVHLGAQKKETVGFEDAGRTLKQLTDELAPSKVLIPLDSIESALWSANLLSEQGQFWSPHGETFDDFIKRLLRFATHDAKLEFDKFYCRIKTRQPNNPT